MTTTLQDLKPSQIKPHKHNIRREIGDITELTASIATAGVVEPLIVAPNGTGATFTLLAGHRRLAAAKSAKLKTIPCLVREDLVDEQQQIETMLIENVQRSDLTPIEEAEAYQQLLAFDGYTQKRIAETTGRAARTITARLKLAKLPESTREKIHTGQLSLADATAMSELADDDKAIAELEAALGTHSFNWTLERLRRQREVEKVVAAAAKKLQAAGVRVWTDSELADLRDKAIDDDDAAPEPWLYIGNPADEEYDLDDLPIAPDAHADCPGHGAKVERSGETFYVCTEPARHADLLADKPEQPREDPAVVAQREADRTARIEREANLEAAAVVRRRHLADNLDQVGRDFGAEILRTQVLFYVSGGAHTVLGDVLLPNRANDEDLSKQLRARLDSIKSLEQLAALLAIAIGGEADWALAKGWGWPAIGDKWNSQRTDSWRAKLVDVWGYDWSDFERELLTKPSAQ
jgi:ParB family chromosome partitioning protein